MRNQVLQAIHLEHQGENKCILQARESVFWYSFSTNIRQMVKNSDLCNKHQPSQPKLSILQPPTWPWASHCTLVLHTTIIQTVWQKEQLRPANHSWGRHSSRMNVLTQPCGHMAQLHLVTRFYHPTSYCLKHTNILTPRWWPLPRS